MATSIVTLGGGTGTHTVLSGLKKYVPQISLKAIVTMADSGGSTGILRDEFGYLPVGDVRMALAALAEEVDDHQKMLRQLFLHRFDKGNGLSGHNFGNLLLVALTDLTGSEEEAIRVASKLLRVKGEVIPVTTANIELVAEYDDGTITKGETDIDECHENRDKSRIIDLYTSPRCAITESAERAIAEADLILLGPGDLYTSILATCVSGDCAKKIRESSAKIIFVTNLMTKFGQTSGIGTAELVAEITHYIGRKPDTVLINNCKLPEDLLVKYKEDNEVPLIDNITDTDMHIVRDDFLMREEIKTVRGDKLKRSLIRHDHSKLAKACMELI